MSDLPGLWHPSNPSFDCLARGHITLVDHRDGRASASWCMWCGSGVSNEHEPEAIADWRRIEGADWEPSHCDEPPCRLCYPGGEPS